jgi:predicted metal-binding protein
MPDLSDKSPAQEEKEVMTRPNEFVVVASSAPAAPGTEWPRRWRYAGRCDGCHVWEGACGCCGRWTTVRAGDDQAAGVERDLDVFGDLECGECEQDRMHELDHIARAASDADHARIVGEVPLAGAFRSTEDECAYRAWCARRLLAPLPPRPRRGPPSPLPEAGPIGAAAAGSSPV